MAEKKMIRMEVYLNASVLSRSHSQSSVIQIFRVGCGQFDLRVVLQENASYRLLVREL